LNDPQASFAARMSILTGAKEKIILP